MSASTNCLGEKSIRVWYSFEPAPLAVRLSKHHSPCSVEIKKQEFCEVPPCFCVGIFYNQTLNQGCCLQKLVYSLLPYKSTIIRKHALLRSCIPYGQYSVVGTFFMPQTATRCQYYGAEKLIIGLEMCPTFPHIWGHSQALSRIDKWQRPCENRVNRKEEYYVYTI